MPTREVDGLSSAELAVADTVGRLMEFWGFKRPMGRIWTVLYLSPEPLGAAELGELLKMSAGGVSMTLSELAKWSAVKKTWRPGERRDFYEAETDVGKMVQRVLRERELTMVSEFAAALETAERSLPRAAKPPRSLAFKRERMGQLRSLAALGQALLTALASGKAIDPGPILKEHKEYE
jgi:DNA-binding transcriptional regulator GbsR (MarR family)